MRMLLLLAGLLAAAPAPASPLRDALEKAWARHPQAQAAQAREAEVTARRGAAESLLAAPPSVSLAHFGDQLNDGLGKREWEAELDLPLWLPGERDARLRLADSERSEWSTSLLALRLSLAGELRERVWAAAQADAELELARRRAGSARALERDVARRVAAGDLARSDLLLAQSEALAAEAALLEAESKSLQAVQAYATLTGDDHPPSGREEAEAAAPGLDAHPALEAARSALALAQARLGLARETRRDAPELTFVTRREREVFGEPYRNTVGIKLRLPFATDARNEPLLAAAQTELTQAEAEYRQARARLESEARQKSHEYRAALAQLELAQRKQALAGENLALLQKAFDLGELDLPALLRTKALAFEAELALRQQTVAAGRARSALNQAMGVLP